MREPYPGLATQYPWPSAELVTPVTPVRKPGFQRDQGLRSYAKGRRWASRASPSSRWHLPRAATALRRPC